MQDKVAIITGGARVVIADVLDELGKKLPSNSQVPQSIGTTT